MKDVTELEAEIARLHAENEALRKANDTFASDCILPDYLVIAEKEQLDRDTALLRELLELLAVATFHSPELQAKRTELIEAGLERLK